MNELFLENSGRIFEIIPSYFICSRNVNPDMFRTCARFTGQAIEVGTQKT
jgi:hypothetical protein